jgi:GT2 family glycosyltransferase
MNTPPVVSVGIASRERPESLARTIASLEMLGDRVGQIVVVDDGSSIPLEAQLRAALSAYSNDKLQMLRFDSRRGLAAARTECVHRATQELVLLVDDDIEWLSTGAFDDAVHTIADDTSIFAIAFAQAGPGGVVLGPHAQPAPADRPSYVPTYIGFAHLVRRSVFEALGGYREALVIHGEERELCLRALDAGYHVVYLPQARVAHLADPRGRDMRLYLQGIVHSGVLDAIYNDPLPLMLVRVPIRLRAYFAMRRGWQVDDPGGWWALVRWIARDLPGALALRKPVRWATIRRWRQLGRQAEPYRGAQ